MKKYLKLLFVIMIMTFGLVMAGCSKQITVNLQNYVKLNATGFTGKASFDPEIDINELVPLRPWKAFIFYICMLFIILIGIINVILQINPINFFGIKIEKNE